MNYEEWIERWKIKLLNEHLLEVYGSEDEEDPNETDFYSETLKEEL